jgi:hypothetical protein
MKTTITGFINYKPCAYSGVEQFHFQPCKMENYGYITVMPFSIEVDIPDNFDPRAEQVKALQAEKVKLMADFHNRCTEIERQISKLTAITCEVTE